HLVSLIHFLEFRLRIGIILISIGMPLLGLLTKSLFDFFLGRVFVHAEYFVIIFLCHCFPQRTWISCAGQEGLTLIIDILNSATSAVATLYCMRVWVRGQRVERISYKSLMWRSRMFP